MAEFEGSSVDGPILENLNKYVTNDEDTSLNEAIKSLKTQLNDDQKQEECINKEPDNLKIESNNDRPQPDQMKEGDDSEKNDTNNDQNKKKSERHQSQDGTQKTELCPAVYMYGPTNVEGLQEGELKKWCTCGLSKDQPWCDGAHKGTGFRSLKWTVPHTQSRYELCNCKHTKTPPYCDGSHTNLPELIIKRQAECSNVVGHLPDCKLCTGCGWIPDF